jgi:MYXO-CTERM domain-containing protein
MKNLIATLGLALTTLMCTPPVSAAPIVVSFTPSSQHINIGDSALIDVSISGLGAEILSAFDLNFRYNPSILNWRVISGIPVSGQLGANYGTTPGFSFVSLIEGDLDIQAFALADDAIVAANQADSFLMFSFQLEGMANGVTTFGLGADLFLERNFVGLDALSLQVNVGNACIAVGTGQCTTVPEPSSLGLLGIALAAMVLPEALRRRRDRAKK